MQPRTNKRRVEHLHQSLEDILCLSEAEKKSKYARESISGPLSYLDRFVSIIDNSIILVTMRIAKNLRSTSLTGDIVEFIQDFIQEFIQDLKVDFAKGGFPSRQKALQEAKERARVFWKDYEGRLKAHWQKIFDAYAKNLSLTNTEYNDPKDMSDFTIDLLCEWGTHRGRLEQAIVAFMPIYAQLGGKMGMAWMLYFYHLAQCYPPPKREDDHSVFSGYPLEEKQQGYTLEYALYLNSSGLNLKNVDIYMERKECILVYYLPEDQLKQVLVEASDRFKTSEKWVQFFRSNVGVKQWG
jgi:hypothetical protein